MSSHIFICIFIFILLLLFAFFLNRCTKGAIFNRLENVCIYIFFENILTDCGSKFGYPKKWKQKLPTYKEAAFIIVIQCRAGKGLIEPSKHIPYPHDIAQRTIL